MELFAEGATSNPAFESWFKGSAVIDNSGKPLVCYHGTASYNAKFKKWRPFTHFGTSKAASEIVAYNPYYRNHVTPLLKRIYPVYLSIKKPVELYDYEDLHHGPENYLSAFIDELRKVVYSNIDEYLTLVWSFYHMLHNYSKTRKIDIKMFKKLAEEFDNSSAKQKKFMGPDKTKHEKFLVWSHMQQYSRKSHLFVLKRLMTAYGFDGFFYKNAIEDVGSTSWVILDNSQVWPIFQEGMDNQFFLTPTDRDIHPKYPLPVDSTSYKDISRDSPGYSDSHGPKKAKWPNGEFEMNEELGEKIKDSGDIAVYKKEDGIYNIVFQLEDGSVVGRLKISAKNKKKGFITDVRVKPGFSDRDIEKKLYKYSKNFFDTVQVSSHTENREKILTSIGL